MQRTYPRWSVLVLLLSLFLLPSSNVQAAASSLFFSEYIEGSSNNKALEIYNGTGAAVNLATEGYNIQIYFNGSVSAGLTINLTGTVADGDVYVVAQSSANAAILAQADQTNGAGWYNGDDAVVLRKGTQIIDVIGQIGVDPGAEWGSGLLSTADNTLRRLSTVCAGDSDGSNAFIPSADWEGFAVDSVDGLGAHTANCSGPVQPTVINEVLASTTGADVEYIELYGAPGASLAGLSLIYVEGNNNAGPGAVDFRYDFAAADKLGDNGFFLLGTSAGLGNVYGVTPNVNIADNSLENSSATAALVETASLIGSPVTGAEVVLDAVGIVDATASTISFGAPVIGPDGTFFPAGVRRVTDGVDTNTAADWVIADFNLGAANTPTAGTGLVPPPPPTPCLNAPAVTDINVIQGAGAATPCSGQSVTVEGIVVGDFEGPAPALRGFYLQEETADQDADPLTSEAIFVFNGNNNNVNLGDVVRVTGAAAEFQDQTQISASAVTVIGAATIAPVDVTLPVPSADFLERYEGMLVRLPQTLYVTEFFQLGRFGQVVLSSGGRLRQPTNVVAPGAPALALQAENNLNRILLDDSLNNQNPDPIVFGRNGQPLSASNTLRGGDTATGIVGVLTYTWAGNSASGNAFRVRPVNALNGLVNFEPANPRPASAPAVGGTLKVASFNVLNYFVTLNAGPAICGPAQNVECRGAETAEEFARQRNKLLQALLKLDADVVGLIELENTTGVEPLADIVAGLNSLTGAGTYDFVNTGTIGTDAIKVGLIYKPAAVSPVGDFQILDSSDDPRFIDNLNRPVLAQTFAENAGGEKFTIAVNHLKSKGSDCNAVGDPDRNDGQGNCNGTRTAAAQALVDWLTGDPTGSGDSDFLIVGDLNSYAKEDPITAIVNAGYVDLVQRFGGADAYGYVFDGQWGYLDHALASPTLDQQVTAVAEYHINADEPSVLDYNTNFKSVGQIAGLYAADEFRTSDHDPVVIGLDLDSVGKLTIVLDAQPDTRLNFSFTGTLGDFVLDDGNDSDAFTNSQLFENLLPGETQDVVLNVPPLWYLADINCNSDNARVSLNKSSVAVTPAFREEITCTFTTQLTAVIWGYVYNDRNANGLLDWRDRALRDWTVSLFDETGALVDEEITNRSGQVLFFPVKPGSVTLCQVTKEGWTNTQPGVIDPAYGQPCYSGELPPASIALAFFGNTQERTGRSIEAGNAILSISGVISADADEAFTLSQEEIAAELPEPLMTDEIFLPFIER